MAGQNPQHVGKVYLVGAGPGDAGLITLRGVELLARAEVILYDYLVDPLILAHVRPGAEVVCLGRHGRDRIVPQTEINERLIAAVRKGKSVVRLKGGDPAVFARTAEEIEALARAGIEFEIVPGITAAIAAASYAGIPITHREFASAVAFVTGREQDAGEPKLDYAALARFPGTLVFYMGVTTAPHWTKALVAAGKQPDTPAAIVRRCTFTDQETIRCTLGSVAEEFASRKMRPPAIVIIGDVCNLPPIAEWFSGRPLVRQTVLVTRPLEQAREMTARFTELGAGCLVQPAIEIAAPADWSLVDAALSRLDDFDWLVFSSANGVRFLLDRLLAEHGDLRRLSGVKLAAIGPRTAEELANYYLHADLTPDEYRAESLADSLANRAAGRRFLLARASRGREVLAEQLTAARAEVEQVVVYESRDVERPIEEIAQAISSGHVDWVTVTSSAIARSLVRMFGDDLKQTRLATISPITSDTLRELGHEPAVEAREYTTDGVIDAVLKASIDLRP